MTIEAETKPIVALMKDGGQVTRVQALRPTYVPDEKAEDGQKLDVEPVLVQVAHDLQCGCELPQPKEVFATDGDRHWPVNLCHNCGALHGSIHPEGEDIENHLEREDFRKWWPKAGNPLENKKPDQGFGKFAPRETDCHFCGELVTDDHAGACTQELNLRVMVLQHGAEMLLKWAEANMKRDQYPEFYTLLDGMTAAIGSNAARWLRDYLLDAEEVCENMLQGKQFDEALARFKAKWDQGGVCWKPSVAQSYEDRKQKALKEHEEMLVQILKREGKL